MQLLRLHEKRQAGRSGKEVKSMEAVGAIRAIENNGVETIMQDKQISPQKRDEVKRQGVQKPEDLKAAEQLSKTEKGQAKIERIAEAMDKYVKSVQRDLNIRVDHESGKVMVKVLSRDTGEVIREIPPEELLKLASRMEEMAGVLLNKSA